MVNYSKYISICLFLFFCGKLLSQNQLLVLDKIAAKVGSELILVSDIEEQYDYLQERQAYNDPQARCVILQNIMAQKLLVAQAKLDSIEVGDQEVEAQLDARINHTLQLMNNDVSMFEEYYGQTINQVREQFREDLKSQMLAERMRSTILADINTTPSDVKRFFNQIPFDSLPYFNSEVEVGEILYYPQINQVERDKTREKAIALRARIIDGGEDFAELAKIYSDDPGSARVGGDLGWVKRGTFVPEFDAVVFNLGEGEISTPAETEFGFHIIQLIERRGNSIHARHILLKPKITDEDFELARKKLMDIRQLILSDSITFEQAVRRYSDKKQQSYNNGGRMINPNTGNTFFEVNELDPDIYLATDTMQINEISQPIIFTDPRGERFYRMIYLFSRTDPHRADLKQDFSKIKRAATESKKGMHFEKWMRDKIQSTFVYVDAMYNHCPNVQLWNRTEE